MSQARPAVDLLSLYDQSGPMSPQERFCYSCLSTANALTIDVEDYFHVEAFAPYVNPEEWPRFELRVERNVDRTLQLLNDAGVRGTFFMLGWVADRFPDLARRIAAEGHEIGCHGYWHRRISTQGPEKFREDLRSSRALIEDQSQRSVTAYRAPSFSVVQETLWALDIMVEEGFTVDSSIFPGRHDLYGVPGAKREPHRLRTPSGATIVEFPPSTVSWQGHNVGVVGGGYLRLLPYQVTSWAVQRLNRHDGMPAMVYFHPWELDPEQPKVDHVGLKSRFRHYTNLAGMEAKLRRLLSEFSFAPLNSVLRSMQPG